MAQAFFDEQRDQSLVKAAIVAKYFNAWSRVMIANAAKGIPINRLAYIDLFAGPGRYKDGKRVKPEDVAADIEDAKRLRLMTDEK